MRLAFAALGVWLLSTMLGAAEPFVSSAEVDESIRRGLDFLAKDSVAWKEKYKCASCHHAGLVVSAMHEAKLRGQSVDEAVLADTTQMMVDTGEGKTSLPRPAGIPKAFNGRALGFAIAIGANPKPGETEQAALQKLLGTVKEDQLDDGSWAAWPDTRPPIFGPSNDVVTAAAAFALLPSAGSDPAAKAALDKGVQWLASHKSDDDPQSVALRLMLWSKLGRPGEESAPLLARIRERQKTDGGWSQAPEMNSDAWATGQALYALALAGVKPADAAIVRGQVFLVRSQNEDGSWPMTSRPIKPGGEGSKNLVPIVGAGSAWGVMGLVRSR